MGRRQLHETTLGYLLVTVIAGVVSAVIAPTLTKPDVQTDPGKKARQLSKKVPKKGSLSATQKSKVLGKSITGLPRKGGHTCSPPPYNPRHAVSDGTTCSGCDLQVSPKYSAPVSQPAQDGAAPSIASPDVQPSGVLPKAVVPSPSEHGVPDQAASSVIMARLLRAIQPVYPPLAKQIRRQGVVRIDAMIGTDGRLHDCEFQPLMRPFSIA